MKQEIVLNGMNKEQMLEARQGLKTIDEGFEMLINQVERIEQGEEVPASEIRAAKLKLNEGMYIFNDMRAAQERNAKHYTNPTNVMNRGQRRRNRRG